MFTFCVFVLTDVSQLIATQCAELEKVGEPAKMIEITALTDNNFVRCTRRSNASEYRFMRVTNKGKMLDSINSEHVYIVETDDIAPYIYVHKTRFANPVVRFLFGSPTEGEYQIFVPNSSISTDFAINLE